MQTSIKANECDDTLQLFAKKLRKNERTNELVDGPNASHITPKALDRSCGGQPFEVELAKPKFKNKENGDYSGDVVVMRFGEVSMEERCCDDEIRELSGEEECSIDENFDCVDVDVLVNNERKSTLIEKGGSTHPEDVPTHFTQGFWGLGLSESPLLSGPLKWGQILSRVRANPWVVD
ncbi:hypothetical protein V8G54_019501 [Vigna mungo]|uniref:Uncharacterized protein n=1 Tax=Vigna mungo TaxID=3915 RepID=A0AAQ3NAR2_VIGMU